MPPHLLTNFEIKMPYENEPLTVTFNSAYSRKNLSKIKDGAYGINIDEYKSMGTRWKLCKLVMKV